MSEPKRGNTGRDRRVNIRRFIPETRSAVRLSGEIADVQHELTTEFRVEEATQNHVSLVASGQNGFEFFTQMSPEDAEEFGELLAESARQAQGSGEQ